MTATFRRARSGLYIPRGGGGSGYAAAVLAESTLLAQWRLGEASGTAFADSSGNGHNGTMQANVTRGVTGLLTGDTDKCSDFTAVYPCWGEVTFGSWMSTTTFAAEALVNLDSVSGSRCIVLHDDNGSNIAWRLSINATKLQIDTKISGSIKTLVGSTTLSTGTTYHIGSSFDGTDLKVFLNGTQDGTLNAPGSLATPSQSIWIGALGTSGSGLTDGRIDEVAVYSMLSAARFAAHAALR